MKATTASTLALNAEAISLIRETRYMDAANLLADGIAYNEHNHPNHDDICDDGDSSEDDEMKRYLGSIPTLCIRAMHTTVPGSIRKQEKLNSFMLYHCAMEIVLPPAARNSSRDIMESRSQCRLVSSILFYNMALSLHLAGFSTGNNGLLSQALLAYHTALLLLDDTSQDHEEILLQLAILNNCGHIQSFSQDNASFSSTLKEIRVILFDMTEGGEEPLPESFAYFFANAIYNQRVNTRAAPAA